MILTGMGPVNPLTTDGAKIFAIGYSLFSGVFFLTMVAVLLAPAANLFMHRFHLEVPRERESRKNAAIGRIRPRLDPPFTAARRSPGEERRRVPPRRRRC